MKTRVGRSDGSNPSGDPPEPGDDPAWSETVQVPNLRDLNATALDTGHGVPRTDENVATGRVIRPDFPTGVNESGKLGRFDIQDILGQGGMGVVLAAYDPQLDRRVAIKVLRTRGLSGVKRERETARLLREARALAQLSHPNVVTVYEAGELDERVFIVMEYVSGRTLRAWLTEQKRPVAEILDAYVKAGRGLAAGHQVGLVHRDFKPDNVLVGFDERVRVIDFGLARPSRSGAVDTPSGTERPSFDGDPTARPSFRDAPLELSTAGSLFGTPLYMAPEQHEKRELDARADQFAFCVALYEALYGKMPFPCKTYGELATAVIDGRVIPPPERPDISKRVARAILRGLQPAPDARWPTMDALLDELAPPAQSRRRLVIAAAAITGVLAIGGTLIAMRVLAADDDPMAACPLATAQLAGAWDPSVQGKIKVSFLSTHRSHAQGTVERVKASLDKYADEWLQTRQEVCLATRVRRELSQADHDARMQCLDARLGELRALAQIFQSADALSVDRAVSATHHMRNIDSCLRVSAKTHPATPERTSFLSNDAHQAIHARAQLHQYKNVVQEVQSLEQQYAGVDNPGLLADVLLLKGTVLSGAGRAEDAERALREAQSAAARGKNDLAMAQSWIALIFVLGHQQNRYEDAIALQRNAELDIERAGGDQTLLRSELLYNVGVIYFDRGEYPKSVKAFEEALELRKKSRGPDHIDVALILNSLGGAQLRALNVFASKKSFEDALAISEKQLGGSHIDAALTRGNLAGLAQAMGNFEESKALLQAALPVFEEVYGEHEQTAAVIYSIGVAYNGLEDYAGGVPYYERAVKMFETVGAKHPYYSLSVVGLADCLEEIGQADRALVHAQRGLELVIEAKSDPIHLALAKFVLARALWSTNTDKPRARALATEARKEFAAAGLAAMNAVVAVDQWFSEIDAKPARK